MRQGFHNVWLHIEELLHLVGKVVKAAAFRSGTGEGLDHHSSEVAQRTLFQDFLWSLHHLPRVNVADGFVHPILGMLTPEE
eukprot:Skav200366  [mRNA]  locus=scaffold2518:224506:225600:+ [translate_table: standard]